MVTSLYLVLIPQNQVSGDIYQEHFSLELNIILGKDSLGQGIFGVISFSDCDFEIVN